MLPTIAKEVGDLRNRDGGQGFQDEGPSLPPRKHLHQVGVAQHEVEKKKGSKDEGKKSNEALKVGGTRVEEEEFLSNPSPARDQDLYQALGWRKEGRKSERTLKEKKHSKET